MPWAVRLGARMSVDRRVVEMPTVRLYGQASLYVQHTMERQVCQVA